MVRRIRDRVQVQGAVGQLDDGVAVEAPVDDPPALQRLADHVAGDRPPASRGCGHAEVFGTLPSTL
jgi:hypothetical protein